MLKDGDYWGRYQGSKGTWLLQKNRLYRFTLSYENNQILVFAHTTYYASGEGKIYKTYSELKKDWTEIEPVKD